MRENYREGVVLRHIGSQSVLPPTTNITTGCLTYMYIDICDHLFRPYTTQSDSHSQAIGQSKRLRQKTAINTKSNI